jgi:hypothetical protein
MRKGQNPARLDVSAYTPKRVGLASLVYIPHLSGYFEDSISVLRAHIISLRHNTTQPFDLMVFDNGSCEAVCRELQSLQAGGWIDWLILSRHNLGKTGAINWIFGSLPNEIVGYSDSDVFFRPGWLDSSLEILEAFPQAGLVTAQPCFFDILRGSGLAQRSLAPDRFAQAAYRPEAAVVDEYCMGIGASPESAAGLRQKELTVYKHIGSGVQAVHGASHMQFIAHRERMRAILPLPAEHGLAPSEDRILNQRIDQAGFLHLSTLTPFVYHIGNAMDSHIRPEVDRLPAEGGEQRVNVSKTPHSKSGLEQVLRSLVRNRLLKRFFLRVYNFLFQVYAEN